MNYVSKFSAISQKDIPTVGGKNAALGEMVSQLSQQNIRIPQGFAVTADAYWYFLDSGQLRQKITDALVRLNKQSSSAELQAASDTIRTLIESTNIPTDLREAILADYHELSKEYEASNLPVAVRSSATAEDLPTASFAGQQETFLNVSGDENLIVAVVKCFSSLFTPRAIAYRIEKNFEHMQVACSVGVQKMVNAQSAGVTFTLDPDTGFKEVITINSSWGLGEAVVQGTVNPDMFVVHKPTLEQGYKPIIQKNLGSKDRMCVFAPDGQSTTLINTTSELQEAFSLTNSQILEIAQASATIEKYYSKKNSRWTPMDIEWAFDKDDQLLYIVQARPETIHAPDQDTTLFKQYALKEDANQLSDRILATGQSIGQAIASGPARVIQDASGINEVQPGDIIITDMTNPDWVPIMKIAAGIITNRGGRTCHAAIVSRELGIPAIVGTHDATTTIKTGEEITLDCSQGATGTIYRGTIKFEQTAVDINQPLDSSTEIMLNIAQPDRAFSLAALPVSGVGLARIEFIFANKLRIHPMAILEPEKTDRAVQNEVRHLTRGYATPSDYFIATLAQEIGTIAAAFYPRPVIIRFSDMKSNEYRQLIGGKFFEPQEENPMLGLRGVSRYLHPSYEPAFRLECKAVQCARSIMGLKNIKVMLPFVRTLTEAQNVQGLMKAEGLSRGSQDLEIYMMCEIPSNVILVEQFAQYFDGLSIGSNDLTQFTLAVDRDSELVAPLFNEANPAVTAMLTMAIKGAHAQNTPIGICGQAPSDIPEVRDLLLKLGIDSMSLNPDAILNMLGK